MKSVQLVQLGDGWIYVEVEEAEHITALGSTTREKLPKDVEPVGRVTEKLKDAAATMDVVIKSVATAVHKGMKACEPDEWALEINIGFKGNAGFTIPVLVGGEGNASLKVTAKWKKELRETAK
ncbi:MAG: CU044_2847 family protein [Desulfobacteraceae bacterium]|jgi:hypothetical protein